MLFWILAYDIEVGVCSDGFVLTEDEWFRGRFKKICTYSYVVKVGDALMSSAMHRTLLRGISMQSRSRAENPA